MSADPTTTQAPVALVLAGSKGLGRGCAEELARTGHRLVICARGEEDLARAAEELRADGAEVATAVVDVASPEGVAAAFRAVGDAYGRLDVLVCNAGGPPPGDFAKVTEDDWRTAFELTLMSVVRSVEHALDRMGGGGRIIIVGSSSVRMPIPNLVLSNVFRPGLAGLTKSLAVELGPRGITVNIVSPGRIATDRVATLDAAAAQRQGVDAAEVRAQSEARIPMGRYGEPRELGAMVAFLASPAAGYVTGQTILVDGGMVPTLP